MDCLRARHFVSTKWRRRWLGSSAATPGLLRVLPRRRHGRTGGTPAPASRTSRVSAPRADRARPGASSRTSPRRAARPIGPRLSRKEGLERHAGITVEEIGAEGFGGRALELRRKAENRATERRVG